MSAQKSVARVTYLATEEVRHPIKAAALLYTTPNYILRGPIYLVFVLVLVGLVYLSWAKKDIVVMAPLKLQREAVTIQALGGGMVAELLVEANLPVKAGQPLVAIQEKVRASASPEQEAIEREIRELEDRLDQTIKDYDHRISQLRLDKINVDKGSSTEARAISAQIGTIQQQLGTAQRTKEDILRKLLLARKRLATQKELFDRRDITVTEFERAQEAVNDLESQVRNAEADINKVTLSLQTAKAEKARLESRTDLAKIGSEIASLEANRGSDIERMSGRIAELKKKQSEANVLIQGVSYKETQANYRSTVDGIVTEVLIRKGQLIDAGTPLVNIVKASAALEAQVLVQNKDIGNLKYGQPVSIKYFAYPYQEYGIQTGVIADIGTKPSGLPGMESLYVVSVALDRETIRGRSGVQKQLEIGLEGIAEVKTGEKRWIEMMFTPLSKFFSPPEE